MYPVPVPRDPAVVEGEPGDWHCCPHAPHSGGTQRAGSRGCSPQKTHPQQPVLGRAAPPLSPHLPGGTSEKGGRSPSPLAPRLPSPAPLQPQLRVEKYPGWQAGCVPEWQPAPPAPHPRRFPGVIFSRLAAKRAAERLACLAVFTVWPPAPAHSAPSARRPEQTPTPRRQGPGEDAVPVPVPVPPPAPMASGSPGAVPARSPRPSARYSPAASSRPRVPTPQGPPPASDRGMGASSA